MFAAENDRQSLRPAENIAFILNRMPVILPAEAVGDWLNIRYDAADVLNAAQMEMAYTLI